MQADLEQAMARLDLGSELRAVGGALGEGRQITVRSPIDGSTLAEFASASLKDAEATIDTACRDFPLWRDTPAPVRGELVRQIGNEFRKLELDIATLVTWETGKILPEARG